jgi:hypothetical protein
MRIIVPSTSYKARAIPNRAITDAPTIPTHAPSPITRPAPPVELAEALTAADPDEAVAFEALAVAFDPLAALRLPLAAEPEPEAEDEAVALAPAALAVD